MQHVPLARPLCSMLRAHGIGLCFEQTARIYVDIGGTPSTVNANCIPAGEIQFVQVCRATIHTHWPSSFGTASRGGTQLERGMQCPCWPDTFVQQWMRATYHSHLAFEKTARPSHGGETTTANATSLLVRSFHQVAAGIGTHTIGLHWLQEVCRTGHAWHWAGSSGDDTDVMLTISDHWLELGDCTALLTWRGRWLLR